MSESISMLECRHNLFPVRFAWRGRVYQVDAVNECKTFTRRHGPPESMYHFWVRCEGKLLHLIHSLHTDGWVLRLD